MEELYPKKLIYFIPEIIIFKFSNAVDCLYYAFELLQKKQNEEFNSSNIGKVELISKLMDLNIKCYRKFLSIFIKIIGDKNIKNLNIKCQNVDFLKKDINLADFFSDEDLNSIFTFLYLIRNNSEYKQYTYSFLTTIFYDNMISTSKKYYNLGLRINKLCKNDKYFLRVIIQLLYNNMNESLGILEERFSEYKFIPKSNRNQINHVSNINNNNNQINNINNNNNNNQNNNLMLIDKDKLILLEKSFDDVRNHFLNLIHFYQISSDIKELYDSNSLENKHLINFLQNLYNIIFSKNNIQKIDDKNECYKKIC